jgi:hypothetical protein
MQALNLPLFNNKDMSLTLEYNDNKDNELDF